MRKWNLHFHDSQIQTLLFLTLTNEAWGEQAKGKMIILSEHSYPWMVTREYVDLF